MNISGQDRCTAVAVPEILRNKRYVICYQLLIRFQQMQTLEGLVEKWAFSLNFRGENPQP